jgi:cytochrome bd-type quinol oxidase subunit 2
MNWTLFRADQLALLYIPMLAVTSFDETTLTQYIFLTRIPEIGTGILVLFGTVYFPKYFLPANRDAERTSRVRWIYLKLSTIVLILGTSIGLLALPIFNGARIDFAIALPFFLQLPLILWANLITYSMQSQGQLRRLVSNAMVAGFIGLLFIAALISANSHKILPWLIPLQLTVFILLGLLGPLKEKRT